MMIVLVALGTALVENSGNTEWDSSAHKYSTKIGDRFGFIGSTSDNFQLNLFKPEYLQIECVRRHLLD